MPGQYAQNAAAAIAGSRRDLWAKTPSPSPPARAARAARCARPDRGWRRSGCRPEAEDMLGIVRDVGRVARAPLRPDLVAVGEPPVGERADATGRSPPEARAAPSPRGRDRPARASRSPTARSPGCRGPLQQQHVEPRRMDHDQHRFGDLEGHRRSIAGTLTPPPNAMVRRHFRGDDEQAASDRHRRGVGKARRHQQRHQGRGARRRRGGDRRPRRRQLPHRREVRRRMGREPVAEEGRAALLPALRFGADGRRRRVPGHGRRAVVRQGAAQDHGLGRRALRQGGLPRRAGLDRAPRLLRRAVASC